MPGLRLGLPCPASLGEVVFSAMVQLNSSLVNSFVLNPRGLLVYLHLEEVKLDTTADLTHPLLHAVPARRIGILKLGLNPHEDFVRGLFRTIG